jgi:hypothetical protein
VPFPTGPAYRAPEPRPPHLDPQSAAIVLAPPANQHASPPKRNDLTFHRAYMSGLEGLDPHLEENARGFVENVKNNLRTLVQTYFSSEPTSSRDAFLERIGRDLTSFGYELTDSADGALYTRGAVPPLALPAFVPSPSVSNADPETPRRIRDDPMDGRDRERDYRMSNMRK